MVLPLHVTDAESEILGALWRHGPLTPARLVETVKSRRAWGDATIKTLLGRLMQKQAIRSQREDGRLLYHPLISRDAYVAGEVTALINRLFEGDPKRLAVYLGSPDSC
jgi:predicted transcriptional regulator